MNKRMFLESFDRFIEDLMEESSGYGKCYFKLVNGQECQGWITEIFEKTFIYLDSGPMSRTEPCIFEIEDIDNNSFSYWDDEIKKWIDYFEPNKINNRIETEKRNGNLSNS